MKADSTLNPMTPTMTPIEIENGVEGGDRRLSRQTSSAKIVSEKPAEVLKVKVHPCLKYGVLGLIFSGVFGVFLGMFLYYKEKTTHVLVSANQLKQCSESSQIYAFPALDQTGFLSPLLSDVGGNYAATQLYAFANFSTCALSYTTGLPNFRSTGESQAYQTTQLSSSLQSIAVGLAGNPYNRSIEYEVSYNDGKSWHIQNSTGGWYEPFGDDYYESTPTHCFELLCDISLHPPWSSFGDSGFNLYPMPVVGNSSEAPYLEVIGTLTTQNRTVTAQCSVSLYGQLIPYFTISKSAQPSGVYECTIPENTASALSQALSMATTSISVFTQFFIMILLLTGIGIKGTYEYLSKGGLLSLDGIEADT